MTTVTCDVIEKSNKVIFTHQDCHHLSQESLVASEQFGVNSGPVKVPARKLIIRASVTVVRQMKPWQRKVKLASGIEPTPPKRLVMTALTHAVVADGDDGLGGGLDGRRTLTRGEQHGRHPCQV